MASYDPELWRDYFVAVLGATAALTGLLFVAISINLDRILEFPNLPKRAANTLGVLLALLVASTLLLAPGQDRHLLGVELVVVGVLAAAQTVVLDARMRRAGRPATAATRRPTSRSC